MKTLFGGTDKGLVRSSNQDCFRIVQCGETLAFAVLCDGMGGENGGNVASEMAAEHVCAALKRGLTEHMGESSIHALLTSAVTSANALVYDAACKDPDLNGMGTTMIAAVFSDDMLYLACVGDSRVYCVRPEEVQQLTRDHTVVQMLLDIGKITEEDVATHPQRHFITRAVGVSDQINLDFIVYALAPDDRILLCSDGLHGQVPPEEYHPLLEQCIEQSSVQPLIDAALAAGGEDNITAVIAV